MLNNCVTGTQGFIYNTKRILHNLYPHFCSESWNTQSPDEPVNLVDNPLRLYQEL